jgi:3-oxoacyl-[acyl-carrier protein] reductase
MKPEISDHREAFMRDEVAIVTGAASGIGRHFAGELLQRGYRLMLTDVNAEALTESFTASDRLLLRQHDIRDRERWREMIAEVGDRFGRLDYLFNIAGVIQPGFVRNAELEDIDRHVDVNVKGTMIGTLLAVRVMVDQGFGQVVNVASLTGVAPVAGLDLYSGSKFAVRGFSLAASHGLRGTGVTVTVVCPDLVDTPMMAHQLGFDASALAFSGSRPLRLQEVSRALLRAMETRPMELDLPFGRSLLAKIGGLAPSLATPLAEILTKKGLAKMSELRRHRKREDLS